MQAWCSEGGPLWRSMQEAKWSLTAGAGHGDLSATPDSPPGSLHVLSNVGDSTMLFDIQAAAAAPNLPFTLSEEQVASIYGIAVKTLRCWRRNGIGPTPIPVTRKVIRYLPNDVAADLEARRKPLGAEKGAPTRSDVAPAEKRGRGRPRGSVTRR